MTATMASKGRFYARSPNIIYGVVLLSVLALVQVTAPRAGELERILTTGRYPEIQQYITEGGIEVNSDSLKANRTPLIGIVLNKNLTTSEKIALIDVLLAKGADLDKIDEYGDTPLLYAVALHDLSLTKHLVEKLTSTVRRHFPLLCEGSISKLRTICLPKAPILIPVARKVRHRFIRLRARVI
jgi:hypothetical protein